MNVENENKPTYPHCGADEATLVSARYGTGYLDEFAGVWVERVISLSIADVVNDLRIQFERHRSRRRLEPKLDNSVADGTHI